jgi:cytochrome o ubiquinol oxidase subunit II
MFRSYKFWVCFFFLLGLLAVIFVLKNEHALTFHPKGIIAKKELELIGIIYALMFVIVIPTYFFLYYTAWKYDEKKGKGKYEPEHTWGKKEWVIWVPIVSIMGVLSVVNWYKTHELDPYRPIPSDKEPLVIQVVALDWKWLFIYPKQEIASINFIQFPAQTPVKFELAADNSPMNAFWIPQMSGMIYAMTGMITPLHIMADEPGEYTGRAAEINGEGYADMVFKVKSSTEEEFEKWVDEVKASPLALDMETYDKLLVRTMGHPVTFYSSVRNNLFHHIVMKYPMHEHEHK